MTKPTLRILGTLALATLLAVSATSLAQGNGNGNTGTIKVHDEMDADPDTRNEPHVDCEDFWVEGFNMAAGSGELRFYSWPPTGDKTLVLTADWDGDDAEPAVHFLAGPFTLDAGHYRVEATNSDDGDRKEHTKTKMFWVEACEAPEEPPCGEPGGEPCPEVPPCGEPGGEPCPEEPPVMECPADLAATPLDDGNVLVTFTPANGSDGTAVYRAEADGDFEFLAFVESPGDQFADTTTENGVAYTYTVTGVYGNAESEDCPTVTVTTIPVFTTAVAAGLAGATGLLAYAGFALRRKA